MTKKKLIEKDYVTGGWYLCGWSLNPLVWLDFFRVILLVTAPIWAVVVALGFAFLLGMEYALHSSP